MNFYKKWILRRKAKKIAKLIKKLNRTIDELKLTFNEYSNLLFKFGYIKPKDIRKKAERDVKELLERKREEERERLRYIG